MLKILNLDPERYSAQALAILSRVGTIETLTGDATLADVIADYHVIILRFSHRIDRTLIQRAQSLKIIACNATGVDHIDEIAASEQGIQVLSLKGHTDFLDTIHATAELTWGLILNTIRPIPRALSAVKQTHWQRDDFFAHELHGKTLGIIGLGRIGKKIARYGHAFGMAIHGIDTQPLPPMLGDIPLHQAPSIAALFAKADIISLHVSLVPETVALIDAHIFDAVRAAGHSVYLINTARGQLIDERALLAALNDGTVRAAALDVMNNENAPNFLENNPLIHYANTHDNLLITPHIGGVTQESWEKTECFMASAIVQALAPSLPTVAIS